MQRRVSLNHGWTFTEGFPSGAAAQPLAGQAVDLPHSAVDLPLKYFDETCWQRPFTYQRIVEFDPGWTGQEVSLLFDGAMADAVIWVNGQEAARHRDGYTPFEVRLTPHLRPGGNLVTVRLDGSENPAIPPFGGRIDYLTYAGLYRDVWLKVVPALSIGRVKVETPEPLSPRKRVRARIWLEAPGGAPATGVLTARLRGPGGTEIAVQTLEIDGPAAELAFGGLTGIRLWSPQDPALYSLDLALESAAGQDRLSTRFGFREARFTPRGFRLNGEPLKLMGLNRHQSFPYSGYAQGRRSQERDAEILRHDFGCNIVRTSHYPQSPWFLDRCDEIGLLVFEEIPGWQHIGGTEWKAESVGNVRRMIRRDWNHPSIVLWGVRINESADDHDFYAETNRVAHEEDPTRQTGGVRYLTRSELLEDVYTMNDFVLGEFEQPGANRPRTPLRSVREVTGQGRGVPYLVTEYNGHMFPTKAGDPEQRQAEHVLRHLEVLDAAFGDPQIAGCIGWCFFDYNTHKDFGAGDRICHHGVATVFREPKFAAFAYASQKDPEAGAVMQPVTFWARGERNIGGVLPLIVLTNCDAVELSCGGVVKRLGPARDRFPHLPHPPVIFEPAHFSDGEMGVWGMEWRDGRLTGYLDGKPAVTRDFAAAPLPTRLDAAPDAARLSAADRDEVRVILRGLDQCGNVLPFLSEPVSIRVEGPARLIGPGTVVLAGGTAGFWLRATGRGDIRVALASPRFPPVDLRLLAE